MQLAGADLADVTDVEVTRLADQADGTESDQAAAVKAGILEASATGLTFVLPADLQPGVFSVRLQSASGSSVMQLNAPDIYWTQGDQGEAGTPGGWLRVSGRNIALGGDAILRLTSPSGQALDLRPDSPDPWSAQFAVPATMPRGRYAASLWNGNGDRTAWRRAGTVTIAPPAARQQPVLTLRPIRPARGRDDARRINAALLGLANRGGGTVLLEPGTYWLEAALRMPKGVGLKGTSRSGVTLFWRDSQMPPEAMIAGTGDFSVETLTISAGRHYDIVRGGLDDGLQPLPDVRNIVLRDVTIRASAYLGHLTPQERERRLSDMQRHVKDGAAALRLAGADLVVDGCDIASSMRSVVLVRPRAARLSGNVFRNGARGWYGISGADGVLVEHNRFIGADLQASGGGVNTLDGSNSIRNLLFRGNRFEAIYGLDREALTSDGPGGFFRGTVAVESAGDITLDKGSFGNLAQRPWAGSGLFVLAGKAAGAVFHVRRKDGNRVELDGRAKATIGDGDTVTVVPMQENFLVIGNSFEDTGAAQIYGTGYRHVFADNRFVRSTGVSLVAKEYKQGRGGLQPNFDIQVLDNRFDGPGLQAVSGISVMARQPEGNDTVLSHGLVIRGNDLATGAEIRLDGDDAPAAAISDVLIEGNRIAHTSVGIRILAGVEKITLRDNNTDDVARAVLQTRR
ncbi:hypothetical protein [Rhizobium halophytocola]|uniref:Right-handed parallel beta-helix repeat-containing protein n=1 Tax=Rhizobium halophytocola TaxID=735519 RepID=A0ABS4E0M8_9HYPH|nr:hypothetical protein [Rhizobium halophytocola]MBP1851491.1 hypothetical protein [Rhizobium halophytocola]